MLIGGRTGGGAEATITGDALVLLSNGFASLGYVAGGRLQQAGYPSTGTTFWGAAAMALLLTPVVPVLWARGDFAVASVPAWSAIAYLAIVVTILGYVLWYRALGRGGIARVGLIQFLQPVSGVILAAMLLHEASASASCWRPRWSCGRMACDEGQVGQSPDWSLRYPCGTGATQPLIVRSIGAADFS